MADVLILLSCPVAAHRVHRALQMDAAEGTRHAPRRCQEWSDLLEHAVRSPLGVAIVDPYQGGALGVAEIRRLRERAPRVEVLAYTDFRARRPSDPFTLALLGVRAVVSLDVDDTPAALRECIAAHLNATPLDALVARLGETVCPSIHAWLEPVLRSPTTPATAPGLARLAHCSPRTLRRVLAAAGLPPAGELLAWRRLLHASRLMEDGHGSVEWVARTLDYSDASALRKHLRRLTGLRPAEVVARGGLAMVGGLFVERCLGAAKAADAPPLAAPYTEKAAVGPQIGFDPRFAGPHGGGGHEAAPGRVPPHSRNPLEESMNTYEVVITLSDETLTDLQANGYLLYAFASVPSAPPAQPVVWFQTNEFMGQMTLIWTDTYQVYTATQQSIPGGGIEGINGYPLQPGLGQMLTVTSSTGIGTLSTAGAPGTVTVTNTTQTPLSCGLLSPAPLGGSPAPLCTIPLFGNEVVVMTPQVGIFLVFETLLQPVGSVMEQTEGEGVLIPVTPNTPAAVAFDINKGWSGAGTVFPPGTVPAPPTPGGEPGGAARGGSGSGESTGGGTSGVGSGSGGSPGGGTSSGASGSGGSTSGGPSSGTAESGGSSGGGASAGGSGTDGWTGGGGTSGGGSPVSGRG
jgi:AraC-like DNA-binding protein